MLLLEAYLCEKFKIEQKNLFKYSDDIYKFREDKLRDFRK